MTILFTTGNMTIAKLSIRADCSENIDINRKSIWDFSSYTMWIYPDQRYLYADGY